MPYIYVYLLFIIAYNHFTFSIFLVNNLSVKWPPKQQRDSTMQELLCSIIDCSCILVQYYKPLLAEIICGDIYVALWDLESLNIWYIWGPSIYISIHNKKMNLFCNLHQIDFHIHLFQIKHIIHTHTILPG